MDAKQRYQIALNEQYIRAENRKDKRVKTVLPTTGQKIKYNLSKQGPKLVKEKEKPAIRGFDLKYWGGKAPDTMRIVDPAIPDNDWSQLPEVLIIDRTKLIA